MEPANKSNLAAGALYLRPSAHTNRKCFTWFFVADKSAYSERDMFRVPLQDWARGQLTA